MCILPIIAKHPLVVKRLRRYNGIIIDGFTLCAMIYRHSIGDIVWIDLESPTREEVRQIMDEFDIHPVVGNELLYPTVHPKVEPYDDYIHLVLHFPTVTHKHNEKNEQEVDFVIGKKFLITTHYELIDPLHEFSRFFEAGSVLDKETMGDHAGFLSFYILRQLYQTLSEELDVIAQRLEKIEQRIFKGEEVEMVETISRTNRDLLNLKQATRHHETILESFTEAGEQFFGESFRYYLRAISGEYYKMDRLLEGHKETLLDLRGTNNSLLTTKTNEIMRILTALASLLFPLQLLTALFSMDTHYKPITGHPYDFWIIIGIMAVVAITLIIIFKHKRWI